MKSLAPYRDRAALRGFARDIAAVTLSRPVRLMEVCGGHTAAIYRFALRDLLPASIRLVSGPGCPVCVTAIDFINRAIALAQQDGITIATFGDLIRVPGSTQSLAGVRARGADVRVFYSSADAVDFAAHNPSRTVVFLGIGFETTACTLAATLELAARARIANFRMLLAAKTMPAALRALFSAPDASIDGLILPGHVSSVMGTEIYEFIPREFGIPCAVSGFEPADLLETILLLARQLAAGRADVENQYSRVVRAAGNPQARAAMERIFAPADANWRGFGVIPQSGLRIREDYAPWNAELLPVDVEPPREPQGCRCGDVLRGALDPQGCPLFGTTCTPETPRGACMVSAEGACAAVYHYATLDNAGRIR